MKFKQHLEAVNRVICDAPGCESLEVSPECIVCGNCYCPQHSDRYEEVGLVGRVQVSFVDQSKHLDHLVFICPRCHDTAMAARIRGAYSDRYRLRR